MRSVMSDSDAGKRGSDENLKGNHGDGGKVC
jgi:hypothetical protein